MSTEDHNIAIVFNGEIYNFLELKQELKVKNHKFRGTSDTEVLLALYREYGTEMFSKLNGMFAMCIFDKRMDCLILARDRLGKKPLYYWDDGSYFAWASELRALRKLPEFPTEFNHEAISMYLRLGFVPNWSCIYRGVYKLPPGTWMKRDLRRNLSSDPIAYWTLPPSVSIDQSDEHEWLDKVESLIWDATKIRLRSDVPLGVFLSSGIDSGLVAAAAAELSTNSLTSLTVNFPNWENDEWSHASEVARQLGLRAIRRSLDADGYNLLPEVMGHFDEPLHDTSALPTSLICREAKKIVTVVLSGDGGDEVFAGYDNHIKSWNFRKLDMIPTVFRRAFSALFLPLFPKDRTINRFLKRIRYPVGSWGMGAHVYPFMDWVEDWVKPEYHLSTDYLIEEAERQLDIGGKTMSPLDASQRQDLKFYMLDDILVKVDRMSMRNSLEVRSPLLDYRLVELALQIPPHLRVKDGVNKYLLRKIAKKKLPAFSAVAPKRGFGVPLQSWLKQECFSKKFRQYLCESPLLKSGGGDRIWNMLKHNPNMLNSTFRIVGYGFWLEGR
ncbi:MAG: asparagine synthetase B [Nitrospirales bacterium]|nr:MAG: asparagine synthetase B [Nitrospirales bacterium]